MSVVPRSARYNVLPMGIPSQRRSVRQGVQSGQTFKPDGTKIIRINLPQQSYLDCANTYLTFRHKITDVNAETQANITANRGNGANNEICMDNGAFSWIRNLQVQGADGSVLENIQNYNLLSRVLHRATQPNDHNESSASILQGYGDISERQSWGTNGAGRTYAVQLSASGLMSNSKYLPLKYLQGGLTLQLELDDFAKCHQADTANYSYTIDQVYLHMDLVDFSDEFDAMFRNQLASEGVNLHFDTYSSHIDSLTGEGEVNLEISERASSVKSVYTIIRNNTVINSATTDSQGSWTSRELTKYKYTLGTTDYPRYDVDCSNGGAIPFAEMLKGFGTLGDVNGGSEIDAYSWRGQTSLSNDKYLEIQSIRCDSGSGVKFIAGENITATICFQGKHGLSAGSNARGTGDQLIVSKCVAKGAAGVDTGMLNASGVVAGDDVPDSAGSIGKGTWVVCEVLSETSVRVEKSKSAIGTANMLYFATISGTAEVSNCVSFQGTAKFTSSATDGKDYRFMIAQNFENHFENQILQTGVSASGAVPLALNVNFVGDEPARVDTFVHSDKMLTIGGDGLATISV
tara:strand:+ start:2854 stop:4578 length:1725 start_codon:yes stop_codon:yes gene_type:complete